MFEFDLPNPNTSLTQTALDSTGLTQEEVAEVIRLAESYSLSRADQVKLLLLVRNLKNKAHTQPQPN